MTQQSIAVEYGNTTLIKPNYVNGDNRDPGPPWEYPFTPYQPTAQIQVSTYWPQQITTIPRMSAYHAKAQWDRVFGDDRWRDLDNQANGYYDRGADRHTWDGLVEEIVDLTLGEG